MEQNLHERSSKDNDKKSFHEGPELFKAKNLGGFLLKDDTRGERLKRSISARLKRKTLRGIREERELNRFDRLRSERKKLKKMKKRGLHLK